MPMPKTFEASNARLVAQLEADYMQRVREIAVHVRPKVAEARDLPEDEQEKNAKTIEAACRAALCRTKKEARLVAFLSPNGHRENLDGYNDIRYGASIVVALDVARVIGARWFLKYHGAC